MMTMLTCQRQIIFLDNHSHEERKTQGNLKLHPPTNIFFKKNPDVGNS